MSRNKPCLLLFGIVVTDWLCQVYGTTALWCGVHGFRSRFWDRLSSAPQGRHRGIAWLRQIRVLARQFLSHCHAVLYSGWDPNGIIKQTNRIASSDSFTLCQFSRYWRFRASCSLCQAAGVIPPEIPEMHIVYFNTVHCLLYSNFDNPKKCTVLQSVYYFCFLAATCFGMFWWNVGVSCPRMATKRKNVGTK